MFKDVLKDLVESLDGGIAGVIMDANGIALDSYARGDSAFDVTAIAVEYGVVLGSVQRAAESLSAGAAEEVLIRTAKMTTILRTLNETYFLALAMGPDASLGKGRFLMRTASPKLVAEL